MQSWKSTTTRPTCPSSVRPILVGLEDRFPVTGRAVQERHPGRGGIGPVCRAQKQQRDGELARWHGNGPRGISDPAGIRDRLLP
ncbi:hypothetical protein OG900_05260 [Streptomyces sp. NBC_00433]